MPSCHCCRATGLTCARCLIVKCVGTLFRLGMRIVTDPCPRSCVFSPPADITQEMSFPGSSELTGSGPTHRLDGFIAYYGRHYFAYWRRAPTGDSNTDGAEVWDGFDDASVRDAGSWADVIEKASDGRLMPLLLFFSTIADAADLPRATQPSPNCTN